MKGGILLRFTSSVATTLVTGAFLLVAGTMTWVTSAQNKKDIEMYRNLSAQEAPLSVIHQPFEPINLAAYELNNTSLWQWASATDDTFHGIRIELATETYKNSRNLRTYAETWLESTKTLFGLFSNMDDPELGLRYYTTNVGGVYTTAMRYNTQEGDYTIPIFDLVQLVPVDDTSFVSVHITNTGVTTYDPSETVADVTELFGAYNIPWDVQEFLSTSAMVGSGSLLSDAYLLSGEYTDEKYFEFDFSTGTLVRYKSELQGAPKEVIIPPEAGGVPLKHIASNAFDMTVNSVTSIVIPDSVEVIDDFAFSSNGKLEYVKMPTSLSRIGEGVFNNCYSLRDIEVYGSIISIPRNTFAGCESLESVRVPDTVQTFGEYAFGDCRLLNDLNRPANFSAYENTTFEGCDRLDVSLFN